MVLKWIEKKTKLYSFSPYVNTFFQTKDLYKGENDRVKMMVLFCGEEDPEEPDEEDRRLVIAASGCLAILSDDKEICEKITTVGVFSPPVLPIHHPCVHPPLHVYRVVCLSQG